MNLKLCITREKYILGNEEVMIFQNTQNEFVISNPFFRKIIVIFCISA
jgi:hypothetical protein